MENYKNAIKAALFRESYEGKRLGMYMWLLDMVASKLLEEHKEETCCSEYSRHFEFQCPSNKDEPVIATYHTWNYADRKSTRLNSSHRSLSRMPSSA